MTHYDIYRCKKCGGSGQYYDATVADKAGTDGSGMTDCFCAQDGYVGFVFVLEGWQGRMPFWAGAKVGSTRDHDWKRDPAGGHPMPAFACAEGGP